MREGTVERKTRETSIRVHTRLEGTGSASVNTGIGFFDHMLESFSKHSAIDLVVEAEGDLHVDMHHTVEDVGICIGQAVRQALGDFSGLRRFGHAYVPMDEALSRAALDLANRPYLIWRVMLQRDKIGTMDTELFKEWFQAFAMHSGACLHVESLYGANCHHIVESCFKATARALRQAIEPDPRFAGQAVSTKGAL